MAKIGRKFLTIFIVAVIFLFNFTSTEALDGVGGTGSQGGGGSGALGGLYGTPADAGNVQHNEAYRMDLVYKPRDGERYIIASVVEWVGSWSDYKYAARKYASDSGIPFKESGVLNELARRIANGESVDDMNTNGYLREHFSAENWIHELGVSVDDMNLEHDDNPGRLGSYGYRLLVQQLTYFASSSTTYAFPRKELAASGRATANGNADFLQPQGMLSNFQSDIWTTRDDIGIYNGASHIGYYGAGRYNYVTGDSRSKFADPNNGVGYNIIWFNNPYSTPYDYTVDAACTNCQDTTSNGSFIIQDINNWEAIEASSRYSGENPNVRTYYYKNDNTYCREEIKVDFPDTSKVINVQTGRYFTVGASENDIGYSLDKNFGDISVTRTRECQGAGATSYTQSHPFGTQTEAEGTVDNGTGVVTLKYTENVLNGSQYDKDDITLIAKDCQESISGGTRTMTCNYGLPSYVYRYVKDGQSLYDGRNDSSTIDLGIPNLPISFNNYSTPKATVQLAYELPNDSQLKKSYTKDNTYLNKGETDNVYKKYINGNMSDENDQNELNKSACAKLYGGTNTAGFRVCAQNRTENKIGNNSSSNCVTRNTLDSGNLSERYICPITGGDGSNPPGDTCYYDSTNNIYYGKNGNAVSKEQFDKECDTTPGDKICKYDDSTDTYYGKNGTVVSQEQYYEQCPQECTVINGVYYGKMNSDGTGRKVTQDVYAEECLKYCTIETVNGQTIYYDLQGNASTDPNVEGGYNDDCVSKVTCPPEQCEYGCCPDGSCADSEGNCPFTPPGNPPGNGANNIIYRPIDLINPFPSQNAMIRATGSNWCAYNLRTNKIDCSADNAIVKAHINNNRSADDYDIYSSDPLYEVVLDPDTIKAVRTYNNHQDNAGGYGDYTLNCNGTVGCYSTFLREENIVKITGECSKLGSLKTCAERR